MTGDKLLTVNEIADHLGVSPSWVYTRIRKQGIEKIPVMKVGKYCRFSLNAVLEWLAAKQGAMADE